MSKHTRTIAAIAASSLLAAFAANANKGADYKPHHKAEHQKKFTLTGGATYLEPSFNGLDYYTFVTPVIPDTDGAQNVRTENLEQTFNWGYFLGATYQISKHYDVQATWAQINTSNSDSDTVVGEKNAVIITSNNKNIGVDEGSVATIDGRQTLDYQVLDLTLGQTHNITEMLKTRLFAGVRYAKISADTDITYIQTDIDPNPYDNYDTSFSGVGPEVGVDLQYKIYDKLGVVASFAGAFLIGNQDSSADVYGARDQNSVDADSNTRMVPALNGKLGANWEIPYQLNGWGFGVEAGYQVAYYFQVVDEVQYQGRPLAIMADARTRQEEHNYADVGFMGPYLNFSAAF